MSRPVKQENDTAFYAIKRYVGSGGERVVLRPAQGCKWEYRFSHDKRWRIAKDKFHALLHAAWECGKSGVAMAWEPAMNLHRAERRSIYKTWQTSGETSGKGEAT